LNSVVAEHNAEVTSQHAVQSKENPADC